MTDRPALAKSRRTRVGVLAFIASPSTRADGDVSARGGDGIDANATTGRPRRRFARHRESVRGWFVRVPEMAVSRR
ncbi:hypothetical protein EA472_16660 [Natrarchaeobius oligotrophus]|uniref:Uncharacterized protein n=1 Tax=Natrarchaeobius chitinivorans TaxID=1679083 RepID=A0A3N6MVB9_NATCH|nr:hypothetical protein EA472_16660 [Natrarchaeobius chitinivorans]